MQQKNRKYSEPANSHHNTFVHPEIVTFDDLGIMLDEDLISRLHSLEEEKVRVYEAREETRPWEEEIAYVRREQQIRRTRRDNHMDYLRKSEEEFARAEADLEPGDFDNLAFVYAATGGRPRWN